MLRRRNKQRSCRPQRPPSLAVSPLGPSGALGERLEHPAPQLFWSCSVLFFAAPNTQSTRRLHPRRSKTDALYIGSKTCINQSCKSHQAQLASTASSGALRARICNHGSHGKAAQPRRPPKGGRSSLWRRSDRRRTSPMPSNDSVKNPSRKVQTHVSRAEMVAFQKRVSVH